MSAPPERPELPQRKPRHATSIILAMIAFGMFAVVLIFLSNFLFTPIFVIGAAVFGFTALHYVLWGWWLGRMIREEDDGESSEGE